MAACLVYCVSRILFRMSLAMDVHFLNHSFSKEQCLVPEDDRMIKTCSSVLSVIL